MAINPQQGVTFPESGADATGPSDLRYFAGLAADTYVKSRGTKRPTGSVAPAPRIGEPVPTNAGPAKATGGSVAMTVIVALVVGVIAWFLLKSALWALVLAAVAAIAYAWWRARR